MGDDTSREAVERLMIALHSARQTQAVWVDPKDIAALFVRIRELEAERDALVAEAYQAAALIPMDRLAKGKGISPINISAAIQNLTPADAISAREADRKEVREQALREAASEFIEADISAEILALIEKDKTDE